MKFAEFINKSEQIGKLPLYIISGSEFFLKKQVLAEIKRYFFARGGVVQGLIVFNGKDGKDNTVRDDIEGINTKIDNLPTSFSDIFEEVGTTSMFGKYKLVIVENADSFLDTNQQKLLEYVESSRNDNCLVLDVLSIDKRKRLAKTLNIKHSILIECNKLYDSPAPWEKGKAEYNSELTRWIVMHVKSYKKMMNLKTAFSMFEKTGNNLAIIDKQIEILSVYVGDRKQITVEDIQKVLGLSHREKIYHLLDAIGMKDTTSAIKVTKIMFDTGIENERKNVIYDEKTIAIAIINSLHRRMRDLWKTKRILDNGGGEKDILGKISTKKPFISRFIKQAQNFVEEEMPEKWRFMLEADLLCKTSRLSPTLIIEQLITKLCI